MRAWFQVAAVACLVGGIVVAESPPPVEENSDPYVGELLPKPETFSSWGERADFLKHNVPLQLNSYTYRADTMFVPPDARVDEQPSSRFRLGLYLEGRDQGGIELRFDPNFDMDVELPNLKNRWKVVIEGSENSELPGTDPSDRERGAQVSVRRAMDDFAINTDAGVKFRWLPEAFARVEWNPKYRLGKWLLTPKQKIYVESDDGFGEVTSLSTLRWMGGDNRWVFNTVSAGKWTEDSQGWEWEQTFKLGYVARMMHEEKRGKSMVSAGEGIHGIGMRYSLFGHVDGEAINDRHRLQFIYRRPLYREWVFLEIVPGLEWENDEDWDMIPKLRIGLDMLFWGDS